jgi:glycosyltransferase involved in cell wall biosynthesis
MRARKVLHVTPFYASPEGGGIARASAALCASLAGRGHEVTVVTAADGGDLGEGDGGVQPPITLVAAEQPPITLVAAEQPPITLVAAVRVLRLPGPEWLRRRLVPFGRGLAQLVGEGAFDVAHLHGLRSGLVAQAAAALAGRGTPWVVQPHGTYPHHGRWPLVKAGFDALLGRRVLAEARAVLALSEAEKDDLPCASVVVGSGVAAPGLSGPPPPRQRDLLVFVGTDAPQKRASALTGLLERRPSTRLRLIGRFGPALRRRFDRFGERVEVAGLLSGPILARALAEAALLVHPAQGEAFGLAPFEAALLGTPAVVAGGHGCGEWFARAGGCVAFGGEPALAAEAERRLDDAALGAREAAAVASFARRELVWDLVAARVEDVYEQALGARGARADVAAR